MSELDRDQIRAEVLAEFHSATFEWRELDAKDFTQHPKYQEKQYEMLLNGQRIAVVGTLHERHDALPHGYRYHMWLGEGLNGFKGKLDGATDDNLAEAKRLCEVAARIKLCQIKPYEDLKARVRRYERLDCLVSVRNADGGSVPFGMFIDGLEEHFQSSNGALKGIQIEAATIDLLIRPHPALDYVQLDSVLDSEGVRALVK